LAFNVLNRLLRAREENFELLIWDCYRTSAAEFGITLTSPLDPAYANAIIGQWSSVMPWPIVAAAGFLEHNTGNITTTFSAFEPNQYAGGSGNTYTAEYDPSTG
jgi:hypothetical protein